MSVRQVMRAAIRDEWDGLDRITRDIRPADVVTMANAVTGLAAVVLAARGMPELAALLVLFGILLDGLDGAVARWKGGGPLGGFLDSLADLVTFAVAPGVLLVVLVGELWAVAVSAFFLVCVMLRLARFEALREKSPRMYFSGLSSPAGALLVAAAVLVPAWPWLTVAVAVLAGPLMVSRVRYPKLRGPLGVLAGVVILGVLATAPMPGSVAGVAVHQTAVLMMAAFMLAYLVAGPFYVLTRYGAVALRQEAA